MSMENDPRSRPVKPSVIPPSKLPANAIPIKNSRAAEDAPTPLQSFKSGHLNLDTFSPVNQNGSFEFDRVLKSGRVNRRSKSKGAWKPTWKQSYLVLRPNLLSIYKNDDETGIRASITLSDVTAVASVRKQNTAHVFGVFSSSKNYHFQGQSPADTADWIERISREARVDMQEEINLMSPVVSRQPGIGRELSGSSEESENDDRERPSSPEVIHWHVRARKGTRSRASTTQRQPSAVQDFSGNEMMTSYSDFSDVPRESTNRKEKAPTTGPVANRSVAQRNASQPGGVEAPTDAERVVYRGWLYCLKSKGGVKQWKKLWTVLRPKQIAFYKNEQEYLATKIVSMSAVIDAAEIDPISKSKVYCLQFIMEDKTYRFCAPDEDSLAQWLGSLKSLVAKRAEAGRQLADATTPLRL